jgi:hypothetical protein
MAGTSPAMTGLGVRQGKIAPKNLCCVAARDRVRHEKTRSAQHTDLSNEILFNESFDIAGVFA